MASLLNWLDNTGNTIKQDIKTAVGAAPKPSVQGAIQQLPHLVSGAVNRAVPGQAQHIGQLAQNAYRVEGNVINRGIQHLPQPVIRPAANFINNSMVKPLLQTGQHSSQLLQNNNPYHGTSRQQIGQVGGDIVNVASALPIGKAAQGAKILAAGKTSSLGMRTLQAAKTGASSGLKYGAAFSGAQGLTNSMAQNQNLNDTLNNTFRSAVIGGAGGAVLGGVGGAVAPTIGAGARVAGKGIGAVTKGAKVTANKLAQVPDAIAHNQLIKTDPYYRTYSDQGQQLQTAFDRNAANGLSPNHPTQIQLGKQIAQLNTKTADMRQAMLQNAKDTAQRMLPGKSVPLNQGGYVRNPFATEMNKGKKLLQQLDQVSRDSDRISNRIDTEMGMYRDGSSTSSKPIDFAKALNHRLGIKKLDSRGSTPADSPLMPANKLIAKAADKVKGNVDPLAALKQERAMRVKQGQAYNLSHGDEPNLKKIDVTFRKLRPDMVQEHGGLKGIIPNKTTNDTGWDVTFEDGFVAKDVIIPVKLPTKLSDTSQKLLDAKMQKPTLKQEATVTAKPASKQPTPLPKAPAVATAVPKKIVSSKESIPLAKQNGDAYEATIAKQLQATGGKVTAVGKDTGRQDGGVDLIHEAADGTTKLIQAKFRSRDTTIHLSTVAQLDGAAARYRAANPGKNVVPTIYATKPLDADALAYAKTNGINVVQTGLKGETVKQQVAGKAAKQAPYKLTETDKVAIQNSIPVSDRADFLKQVSYPNSGLSKRLAGATPDTVHQIARKYYQGLNPEGSFELNQAKAVGAKLADAKTPAEVTKIIGTGNDGTALIKTLRSNANNKAFIQQLADTKTKSGIRELINGKLDKPVYSPLHTEASQYKTAEDFITAKNLEARSNFTKQNYGDRGISGKSGSGNRAAGFEAAAVKRAVSGELTPTEFSNTMKYLNSNYVGKKVAQGEVVGNSFGVVRVKTADGKVISVNPSDITAPAATKAQVLAHAKALATKKLNSSVGVLSKEEQAKLAQVHAEATTGGASATKPKVPQAGAATLKTPRVATKSVAKPGESSLSKDSTPPVNVDEYIRNQTKDQEAARKAGNPTGFSKLKAGQAELKRKLVDSFAPIEDTLNQKITANNVTNHITPAIDRAIRADTIAGQYIKDNGLAKVIQTVPNTKEFDQYLIAKHAADLSKNGIKTGRDLAADRQLVTQLAPKYEAQAQALKKYSQGLLDKAADYGLIDRKLATHLKEKYPNYVPANRIFGENEMIKPPKGVGGGKASVGSQSVVQRIKGSDRMIESPLDSLIHKTEDVISQGERNHAAQILTGYRTLPGNPFELRELSPAESVGSKHVISVMRNGKVHRFETSKEVADAAKALSKEQLGLVGQILNAPVRLIRLGATSLNPAFAGANALKDLASGAINSKNPLRSSVANPTVFLQALKASLNHGSKEYGEMVREGAGGTSFDIARNNPIKNVKSIRAEKNVGSKVLYTVTHPSQLVRAAENTIGRSEEFSRALQYYGGKQAALKTGATAEQARLLGAHAGRNNTVNFARAGDYGRVLNSVIPYLNAGVQGSRILIRNAGERPVQTAAKLALISFMPTAAITAWNVGTPERKAAYDDIKDYEKQNNFIIVPPNPQKNAEGKWNVIKIPVSQEIANLNDTVRNGVEAGLKDKSFDPKQLVGNLLGTATSLNLGTPRQAVGQVLPQAAKIAIEPLVNQNLFTGNKVVPDSQKNLDPRDQYGDYTSGTAKVIGRNLNISPRQIDNTFRTATGGLGQNILNASDSLLAKTGHIKPNEVQGKPIGTAMAARFAGAQGSNKYDSIDKKSADLTKQLKSLPGYKSMDPSEKAKALNRLTNAVTSTYTTTKPLTPRQQAIDNGSAKVSDYLTPSTKTSGATQTAKDMYKSPDAEYKALQAKYKTATYNSDAQRIQAQNAINKAKVGATYDKSIRDLYNLSSSDLNTYVSSNPNGKAIVDKVLAYSQALKDAGITSTAKFKNKYGQVTLGTTTSSTGTKGRTKSSSTKIKTLTTKRINTAAKGFKVRTAKAPTFKNKRQSLPKLATLKTPKVTKKAFA